MYVKCLTDVIKIYFFFSFGKFIINMNVIISVIMILFHVGRQRKIDIFSRRRWLIPLLAHNIYHHYIHQGLLLLQLLLIHLNLNTQYFPTHLIVIICSCKKKCLENNCNNDLSDILIFVVIWMY